MSSPHAWGCFLWAYSISFQIRVFPTCVGVFPNSLRLAKSSICLPHMRGGVSAYIRNHDEGRSSSPHAWGCFSSSLRLAPVISVFPTCVGVFLLRLRHMWLAIGLPHMRGGVSQTSHRPEMASRSSPHAWGCFSSETGQNSKATVFPTCVGVFPGHPTFPDTSPSLPHMRGGVSSGRSRYSFN